MKQPSHEIVEKAKELEPLWRMDIYEGCWVRACSTNLLITNVYKESFRAGGQWQTIDRKVDKYFPIPDISDCLEKLRELKDRHEHDPLVPVLQGVLNGDLTVEDFHDACLEILIEVIKNGCRHRAKDWLCELDDKYCASNYAMGEKCPNQLALIEVLRD